jgi:hypothetical protein
MAHPAGELYTQVLCDLLFNFGVLSCCREVWVAASAMLQPDASKQQLLLDCTLDKHAAAGSYAYLVFGDLPSVFEI